MQETKNCVVCGNPFDYEGKVCFYCETTAKLIKEEEMTKKEETSTEFDKVEFPEDTQEQAQISRKETEPADIPETNGESVHFRIVDVAKVGTQVLEDLLNDGYVVQNVAGAQDVLVYLCSKVEVKK